MSIGEYEKWREYRYYSKPEILEPGPEHRFAGWGMELYALTKEQMQALMAGKQIGFDVCGEYGLYLCYEETYNEEEPNENQT